MKVKEIQSNAEREKYIIKCQKKIQWLESLKNSHYKTWNRLIDNYVEDLEDTIDNLSNPKIKFISFDSLHKDITNIISVYVNGEIQNHISKLDYTKYKAMGLKYLKVDIFNDKTNMNMSIGSILQLKNDIEECSICDTVATDDVFCGIRGTIKGVKGSYKDKFAVDKKITNLHQLFEELDLLYPTDCISYMYIDVTYKHKSTTRIIKEKLNKSNYLEVICESLKDTVNKEFNYTFSNIELKEIIDKIKSNNIIMV